MSAGGDAIVAGRDLHVHLAAGERGDLLAAAGLPDDLESPYKGLDSFRVKDAGLFFGRDREALEILGRVSGDGLLIVSGVSGAGKSSLLRAGVVPRFDGPHLVLTPTATPLDELANALAELTGAVDLSVGDILRREPGRFAHLARQAATVAARRPDTAATSPAGPLLVVVDQFEETFTRCRDEDQRRAFIATLHAAATAPLGPQRLPAALVALVVRADFETRCGLYPELADAVQHRYLLLPMSEAQLRLAIAEPAERVGSSVAPALTNLLVGHVQQRTRDISSAGLRVGAAAGPEVLPLLSYALDQAWRERAGITLTLADYERAGGIEQSIAKSAEAAFASLTAEQQSAAQRIFIRLTVTGSDGTVSTTRVTRTAVAAGIRDDDATVVLEAFSGPKARLITLGEEGVEISHAALLTAWSRLAEWLNGDLDDRVRYGRLTADARTWEENRQAASYLYPAGRLAEVEESAKRWADAPERYPLDAAAGSFLQAARRAVRWARRRRRTVIATLSALTLAFGVAAGAAWHYALNADGQHAIGLSRQLAAESLSLDATDPIGARQLAAAAWRESPTAQAGSALTTLVTEQERNGELPAVGAERRGTANDYSADVAVVAFSPDGRLLASANDYGYIRVWNLATGALVTAPWQAQLPTPHGGGAGSSWDLEFSPDDKLLASVDPSGTVRLWTVATGHPVWSLPEGGGVESDASAVVFSPNGTRLAVWAGNDVLVWNRSTGAVTRPSLAALAQAPADISVVGAGGGVDLMYSPQGHLLAAIQDGLHVRVWDTVTGLTVGKAITITGSAADAISTTFDPAGKLFAAFDVLGDDVQLWSVATGRYTRLPFLDHSSPGGLEFSYNGALLVETDVGGDIRIWDTATGRARLLRGVGGDARVLEVSPDGRLIARADSDDNIRLLDAGSGELVRGAATFTDKDRFYHAAVATDDGFVAADSGDVAVWDSRTYAPSGETLAASIAKTDDMGIALSPDQGSLATIGTDKDPYARLWNVTTGKLVEKLPLPKAERGSSLPGFALYLSQLPLAFSADGHLLVFGTSNASVYLWDTKSNKIIGMQLSAQPPPPLSPANKITDLQPFATAVRLSTDNQLLQTANAHGYLQTFEAATGKPAGAPKPIVPSPDLAGATSFSPDGKLLAGLHGGKVWVWNAATGKTEAGPLTADQQHAAITRVAFSPDGKLLAGISSDGYVRLWDTATDAPLGVSLPVATAMPAPIPDAPAIASVAFSPDGNLLVASYQGDLGTWQVAPLTDPYRTLCAEVGAPTSELWSSYASGEPQPDTCAGVSVTSVDTFPRLPLVSPASP